MTKRTIREASDPTDFKDPTEIKWDDIFDDPTSKGEISNAASAADDAAGVSVPRMEPTSAADTARATAGMTPTDAMRDVMSRINVPADDMDDDGSDEVDNLPVPAEITPEHLPAIISREIAMSDPHAVNPTWHAVSNLPGNMSRAILTLGKSLFRAFTRTPTEDIVMIGNVGGQGPNTTREVRSVAAWVEKHGVPVDDATVDFNRSIPGYTADVKHYVVGGVRFKLVRDQFGDYIYAWPESDSIGGAPQITTGNRPSRSLSRR